MSDLTVIVPTRGRPAAVAELAAAFQATCRSDTTLLFSLDDDDPRQAEYGQAVLDAEYPRCIAAVGSNQSMVEALNNAAAGMAPFAIGFMGDDHRPRTEGWDVAYVEALRELGTGIVYGNDLVRGGELATQCAMTADIPKAIGYMAPPVLRHLYVDNFWMDLGRELDAIRYLPEVVVQHLHPVAGTAEWDEGYARVNHPQMYDHDAQAYHRYVASGGLAADVEKIRASR